MPALPFLLVFSSLFLSAAACAAALLWPRLNGRAGGSPRAPLEEKGLLERAAAWRRESELQGRLLSVAAHDASTPLASIRGYASALSAADPRAGRFASNILQAAGQIERLVADLTGVATLEAGRWRLSREPFDLEALARELLAVMAPQAAGKGLRLEASVPAGLRAFGDRFRVGQALSNFLANAVRSASPGGRVELRAFAGASRVVLEVSDSGPGVPERERSRIFERHYQSPGTGRGGRGWGMGLYIAREVALAHGGGVSAGPARWGRGAAFRLWLPKVRRPPSPGRARRALAAVLLLAAFVGSARAGGPRLAADAALPLSEVARYELSLQEKAEGILDRVLGSGRAMAVIEMLAGSSRSTPLSVTLILDARVSAQGEEAAKAAVSSALRLDPARGDALRVLRARFASPWLKLWGSKELLDALLRYGVPALLLLPALLAAAAGVWRLALAVQSASARSEDAAPPLSALPPGPDAAPPRAPSQEDGGAGALRLTRDQTGALAELLATQDLDNAALVASWMDARTLAEFLDHLAPARQGELLARLAKPRYVDPEIAEQLRMEIERRISGVVGGLSRLCGLLEGLEPMKRLELLGLIKGHDPAAAVEAGRLLSRPGAWERLK